VDAAVFLHHLVSAPDYEGQVAHVERIARQSAAYGTLSTTIEPALQTRLESTGVHHLYKHQASALQAVFIGEHVMIATPSASGKTLCYQVATLNALLRDSNSRALYLFPTKALAQDQLRSLTELACPDPVAPNEFATFDGDTPQRERSKVRRRAKVVLTNPDMLHLGILPNHQSWAKLFRNLNYVVVDEAHVYRGVFGSHMANVMRRLRRICALYGSSPRFICCSATIANPGEHAEKLIGVPFAVVDEDVSPHGEKYFVFWNPPPLDKAKNARRSANSEAAALLRELVKRDIRSLVFARTRKLAELIYIYARGQLPPALADRIMPYRAGYLPEDRRRIERQFFDGSLLALVATTALELGIDIGDLDATVLTGYPGSIASAWQQAGRSGRNEASSLSFLIAQDNPLDQYLMRQPQFFFSRSFDNALIDPSNRYILKPHLLCAAWEKPVEDQDRNLFGDIGGSVAELEQAGTLRKREQKWYPSPSVYYPARDVNLRAAREGYAIVDSSRGCLLETVEASVAFSQIHPGAIYLHQGESYLIGSLDLVACVAHAAPSAVDYHTQAMELTDIRITRPARQKEHAGTTVGFGDVTVTSHVRSYLKKRQSSEEIIGEEPLDLPSQVFSTRALWFDLPPDAMQTIADAGLDLHGGLHACEHAAIGILPLFALCDRNDIGGVSTPFHPDTGKPQIFIYDAYPGGIGIAERGFDIVVELWKATLKLIQECPCSDGCPSCIQSPKCGNNNQPLDKSAAVLLLRGLLR